MDSCLGPKRFERSAGEISESTQPAGQTWIITKNAEEKKGGEIVGEGETERRSPYFEHAPPKLTCQRWMILILSF